ncbi:stage V sporulation protein AA [Peribacillus cavernae]|uniref:Stage V sporulation protein AA n=1 Tax=Peribacillus cavernae TaxID=1674310 RepID=A0A433HDW8_9BACI|nr:stage V sporulation protein AA [Peribacillus cavernae]MDQ0219053.1 stage V sporulation protein AA [Peribacillus cavernae]RUQ26506.1 stage V sporulation protein AA [Peribacillus cavernae]
MDNLVYVRMRHRVQVRSNQIVKIKDIAKLLGQPVLVKELEETVLLKVTNEDNNIIIVDLVQLVKEILDQNADIEIQAIGPSQTIIEVVYEKKKVSWPLFIAVWILLFVGAAITIMNFHVDVSMQTVHQKLFKIITGKEDSKPLLIQIPYSFGLGLGMILFFNHFFRKRFNEEPSPLEVEMFNYQQDLDQYVIMNENKESIKKIDDN